MDFSKFSKLRDGYEVDLDFGKLLYGIVSAIRPKVAVETGTHAGISTAFIAQALKDNGFGHLTSYDIKDFGAQALLEDFGLEKRVTLRLMDSRKILESEIDFAFIDSEHSGDFVEEEWANLKKKLAPYAVVVWENASTGNQEKWPEFGVRRILDLENCVYLPAPMGAIVYYHGGKEGPGGPKMR